MGGQRQRAHDDRYAVAEDYMEVVYKLWEGNWADDAVIADAGHGTAWTRKVAGTLVALAPHSLTVLLEPTIAQSRAGRRRHSPHRGRGGDPGSADGRRNPFRNLRNIPQKPKLGCGAISVANGMDRPRSRPRQAVAELLRRRPLPI
jgi:hypothetical protein